VYLAGIIRNGTTAVPHRDFARLEEIVESARGSNEKVGLLTVVVQLTVPAKKSPVKKEPSDIFKGRW
jgi:hypothetical protein